MLMKTIDIKNLLNTFLQPRWRLQTEESTIKLVNVNASVHLYQCSAVWLHATTCSLRSKLSHSNTFSRGGLHSIAKELAKQALVNRLASFFYHDLVTAPLTMTALRSESCTLLHWSRKLRKNKTKQTTTVVAVAGRRAYSCHDVDRNV